MKEITNFDVLFGSPNRAAYILSRENYEFKACIPLQDIFETLGLNDSICINCKHDYTEDKCWECMEEYLGNPASKELIDKINSLVSE